MKTTNFKKYLAAGLIAGLSVSTLASNVETLVKADETKKIEIQSDIVANKAVSADVVEIDSKVFVVVTANKDVTKAVLNVSVDGIKYDKLEIGNMASGEVKEVELEMPAEGEAPVRTLPNTAVVSDKVEFSKEVQGHKVKGSVSFEYDNGLAQQTFAPGVILPGDVEPSEPVVEPTVDEPTVDSVEPSEPTIPVDPTEPTTPTKPSVNGLLPLDPSVIKGLTPILDDEHKNGNFEYKDTWYERAFDAEEIYIDDENLEEGQYKLKEGGSPMVVKYTVRQVYVNGVHIDKYDMELDRVVKDEGTPRVYIRGTKKKVVEPTTPTEPTKPTTPTINNDIEKGMPANAKWTRAQLQVWGYQLGNISGNYDVDGDLGTFGSEDEMTKAVNAGLDNTFNTMTAEQLKDLPSGYSWYEGANGYRVSLYDGHGVHNA